jgi:endoglucanase
MKQIILLAFLLPLGFLSYSQTDSLVEGFTEYNSAMFSTYSDKLKAVVENGELTIVSTGKTSWEDMRVNTKSFDMSKHTFISFKVKSDANVTVRIDLVEQNGSDIKVSNAVPISKSIKGDGNWVYMYLDYTGHFDQAWPGSAILNTKKLTGLAIILNPGASFTGKVTFDSIAIGRAAMPPRKRLDKYINLDQIGFYPESEKIAIVNGSSAKTFSIFRETDNKVVFTDTLSKPQYWKYADETVRRAVFTNFKDTGSYKLYVEGLGYSFPFHISKNVYGKLAESAIKAFYYQRCDAELTPEYAGIWARKAGQPDTGVLIHSSAASLKMPEGKKINSLRGWYDAGDYNKYIVNSGITVYTLLSVFENFPTYTNGLKISIPETKNNVPDLLDEILWNLRWMLTMQDKNDGGVYHKLTHANFTGMVLPDKVKDTRYVVQKSTSASLDFCAVMAQAARVLKPYSKQLPGLADSCMMASVKAWSWAKLNQKAYYDQNENNKIFKPEITTGAYGDGYLVDEFMWAATELFISTGNDLMLPDIQNFKGTFTVPDWANVQTLGMMSIVRYKKFLGGKLDTSKYKNALLDLTNTMVSYSQTSAFRTAMGQDAHDFSWGSNAMASNESILLLNAYALTKDKKYYTAAYSNLDYLLGRNPLNYCFVTGEGSKSPVFPHHRLSEGDNNVKPVPGLLVGGPQPGREDGCSYPWEAPAKNYTDEVCSYSTNEIAINWNAPLANIVCSFEAYNKNLGNDPVANPRTKLMFPDLSNLPKTDTAKATDYNPILVFPNLKTNSLRCMFAIMEPSQIEVRDATGHVLASDNIIQTGTILRSYPIVFETGTYFISLKNKAINRTKTIIINK